MWVLRASAMVAAAAGGSIGRSVPLSQSLRSLNLTSFTTSRLIAPFTSSAPKIRPPRQAVKGEAGLKGVVDKDTVEEVKSVLEMANRASSRREILHTDFLTSPVLKEAMAALEEIPDIKMVARGGYPEAKRCRLSVAHLDVSASDPDIVAAMSISGNFGSEPCSHSDFLGSILATGIVRDKIGDILLQGEKGAQFLVVPEHVDLLMTSLDKVRNVSVTCKRIPLLALAPPRTESLETVKKPQRLQLQPHAIPSAGFKMSQSKMADLISKRLVRVNTVTKTRTPLTAGDIISITGKERLQAFPGEKWFRKIREEGTNITRRRLANEKKRKVKVKAKRQGGGKIRRRSKPGSFYRL